ncbi:MAG: histidine kinase [Methylotenera sp.]|nr:MAG: histidine kinase [Methylotenera sp.]
MSIRFLTLKIESELDVVAARQRAREIAGICAFGLQDQARISTAVSELARNVYNYAVKGRIEFAVEGNTVPQLLIMTIEDQGPGIPHIEDVLSGTYQSSTGMGVGVIGAKRLMDQFQVDTSTKGTTITLKKLFPKAAPLLTSTMIGSLVNKLSQLAPNISLSEIQHQNRELLRTLDELNARQKQLLQLTEELEDTNRGVLALYAELDEKADHLRRADELKSRFLSNMSHEFRTPLNSIRALAKLLLDETDGELSEEQEKQVEFILKGAITLSDLVNDLLDIAKIEAGKTEVKPVEFQVDEMFSALRGMLKPLLVSDQLELNFMPLTASIKLFQDEAKVSQILRNFISNALKFTEAGSINVSAVIDEEDMVTFRVIDTGLGINENDLGVIFEEFSQVENHLQIGVKGTGLGLPLCRNLAALLQGRVDVISALGKGSTFSLSIPAHLELNLQADTSETLDTHNDSRLPILIIEDQEYEQLVYKRYLDGSEFRAIPVKSLREAEVIWPRVKPVAVLLDIMLKGEDSWRWLSDLKSNEARQHIPVIISSSVDDKRKGIALGADVYHTKPMLKVDLLSALRKVLNVSEDLSIETLTNLKLNKSDRLSTDTPNEIN